MRTPTIATFALLLAACDLHPKQPGEAYGEFRVVARLESNGCGPSAVSAPGSVEFDVEIRRDGDTGYWIPEGQAPVAGDLDDRGTFLFQIAGQMRLREEDTVNGLAACVLDRVDEVRGVVLQKAADVEDAGPDAGEAGADADADAGTVPEGMEGTEALSFATASGADCSDQLGLQVGQFVALPCQIRYTLEGDALDQPE